MQQKKIISHITNWLSNYLFDSKCEGFVIGVSGGIDSAVVSTLCAKTKNPILCLEMPILQKEEENKRSREHIKWLKKEFENVSSKNIELTRLFKSFSESIKNPTNQLALANARARLRMTTLYYFAQINNYLVVGTGNKVEDFGIGFFTKYGDGGVDISPIADLLKNEVYGLAYELDIIESIQKAAPTDGLWDSGKTDEEQIGATYTELEWAMSFNSKIGMLSERQKEVLRIYENLHKINKHKMNPIPICKIPNNLK